MPKLQGWPWIVKMFSIDQSFFNLVSDPGLRVLIDALNAPTLILIAALLIDFIIGDPWSWLHPVQVMGWYITAWSKFTWKYLAHPIASQISGIGLCGTLILGCGLGSWIFFHYLQIWQPIVAKILEVILLASCLAGRSLRQASIDVLGAIQDLPEARQRLSKYVGRDTAQLTTPEIYRAILETVAENSVDGVTAPWFYAILGASIPGLGAVPLAVAYKAASTLDSMVGYLREPYKDLGWASAKFEDILTWLPCRLTVVTLALFSGKPLTIWQICQRDAVQDPSPNSGWSECVYAAILGVQLGGDNYYRGELRSKPLLGDPLQEIEVEMIDMALNLTQQVVWAWLLAVLALVLITSFRWRG
jgi:adenosylcobinamide-phosphate synthase